MQGNARIQLSFNNIDEMEQEEENESQDDILTKLTNFVDSNLRIFRVSKKTDFSLARRRQAIESSFYESSTANRENYAYNFATLV